MFGTPLSPEEIALRRRADPESRASDDFPAVEIAGHRVHIFKKDDGAWDVWLNTEAEDFDGICIGWGTYRNEAIGVAVSALEAVVAFLQGPPAESGAR